MYQLHNDYNPFLDLFMANKLSMIIPTVTDPVIPEKAYQSKSCFQVRRYPPWQRYFYHQYFTKNLEHYNYVTSIRIRDNISSHEYFPLIY